MSWNHTHTRTHAHMHARTHTHMHCCIYTCIYTCVQSTRKHTIFNTKENVYLHFQYCKNHSFQASITKPTGSTFSCTRPPPPLLSLTPFLAFLPSNRKKQPLTFPSQGLHSALTLYSTISKQKQVTCGRHPRIMQ